MTSVVTSPSRDREELAAAAAVAAAAVVSYRRPPQKVSNWNDWFLYGRLESVSYSCPIIISYLVNLQSDQK